MDQAIFRKRLLYKSSNRGWKENDLLLGEFAKKNIELMDDKQLAMLDLILDEPDADIFSWIIKKAPVPEKHNNQVMIMLQEFKYKS